MVLVVQVHKNSFGEIAVIIVFCSNIKVYHFNTGGSMVTFKQLAIEPLPLVITRSSAHYLSSNVILKRNIPLDAELSLVVNKTINFGGMQFPYTVPCHNGFGSCRYSFCDIFQQKQRRSLVCPLFSKYKQACSCPIKKGNYSVRRVKVKLPLGSYGAVVRNAAAINVRCQIFLIV